jgi:hypothetical protein
LRHAQCILDFYNANLFTQCSHEADLRNADAVIDAGIADLVLLIDVPLATPRTPKAHREMQMRKKLYPATYKSGGRGWETNPLLTEIVRPRSHEIA